LNTMLKILDEIGYECLAWLSLWLVVVLFLRIIVYPGDVRNDEETISDC